MQLNLESNGSYAFPDLMRNTPGDLKGERQQLHATRGVCNAMPMRREGPWRDSGRKKRAISQSCSWQVLLLMVDKSNTRYICDVYVYCFTVEIYFIPMIHDLLVTTCWYTLYNWLPLKHAYRTAGTLCKKLESGIFGTHFQKMQNSQIP
jgi:hypothetical protein